MILMLFKCGAVNLSGLRANPKAQNHKYDVQRPEGGETPLGRCDFAGVFNSFGLEFLAGARNLDEKFIKIYQNLY
ncbi:MAG: hypothetical protein OHK0052_17470 [Anaerolineales bacterium]